MILSLTLVPLCMKRDWAERTIAMAVPNGFHNDGFPASRATFTDR
jgi:hypothetical protein